MLSGKFIRKAADKVRSRWKRVWGFGPRSLHKRLGGIVLGSMVSVAIELRQRVVPWRDIPVIINNFNRLDCLRDLISWLERAGMVNIYVIDNGSTYPPLLEYYKTIGHRVFYIANTGPHALWLHDYIWRKFRDGYYIYTDSDVVPDENCPLNAVEIFYDVLRRNLNIQKVGFSLRIDDIPDCYGKKEDVIAWEKKYWKDKHASGFFLAPIDTTFALYRPYVQGGWYLRALRSVYPYSARHTPWYQDTASPSAEEQFYCACVKPKASSWTEGKGALTGQW